jgi:hypothetical protein
MGSTDFSATEHAAELEARRLGSGRLEALIQQVGELLACGELEPSHPWLAALLWRRVCDLGSIERVVTDDVVAPLLDLPSAAAILRAVASRDPSGRLAALAESIANVSSDDEFGVLVRRGLMSEADAARARRRVEFEVQVGRRNPRVESRRRARRRRRLLAEMATRDEGLPPWPEGRGRRPGSEGKRAQARREDLRVRLQSRTSSDQARVVALRSDAARALVREHAERHGVSLATAERDLLSVRRQQHELGLLPVAHLGAKQEQFERRLMV